MTAIRDDAACNGAVVRKPPMKETAGGVARWRVRRYGDLTAVVPEWEYNFCVMCLMAAFCTASAEQILPRDSVHSRS
jgi:hypothetical protein